MSARGKVAVVVAAAAFFGAQHHPHHHGAQRATLTSAAIPWSGGYTPHSWSREILHVTGLPETRCNIRFFEAWARAEGGNWENSAVANPTNTTQWEPGSWVINSAGVRAYPNWHEGIKATARTLGYPAYSGIIAALRYGDAPQLAASAVSRSPWGTGPFTATC